MAVVSTVTVASQATSRPHWQATAAASVKRGRSGTGSAAATVTLSTASASELAAS